MRTVNTEVYTLDELSDGAKQKARYWWASLLETADYAESVISDFLEVCRILGVSTSEKQIQWSGFCSQGDGASFAGSYSHAPGAQAAVGAYAPEDGGLRAIAGLLEEAQALTEGSLTCGISTRGGYSHSGTMQFDFGSEESFDEKTQEKADALAERALRSLADWLYTRLQVEYEWAVSDEQVDAALMANEYTFTFEGVRFG